MLLWLCNVGSTRSSGRHRTVGSWRDWPRAGEGIAAGESSEEDGECWGPPICGEQAAGCEAGETGDVKDV